MKSRAPDGGAAWRRRRGPRGQAICQMHQAEKRNEKAIEQEGPAS